MAVYLGSRGLMLHVESFPMNEKSKEPATIDVDPVLLRAAIEATRTGFAMTTSKIIPVGASRLATARHPITVVVGLVGQRSGSLALNFSEPAALHLSGGLMGAEQREFNEDCVDALMELGNMVAGAMKTALADTEYTIANISLPSLILGQSYSIAYARGIRTVSVELELPELPFSVMSGRYVSTTVSLLGGAGSLP